MEKLLAEKKKEGHEFKGIRGRGLAKIVSEWSDELKFEDREEGGLRVIVKKHLKDKRFRSGLPESTPTHLVLEA